MTEYLLISSATLLIGSCLVHLLRRPPIRLPEPISADPDSRLRAPRTTHLRRALRMMACASDLGPWLTPIRPGPDRRPPEVFTRPAPAPEELPDDSAAGDAPPYSPQELRRWLSQRPLTVARAV